jgi:hypothetical protein
VKRERAALRGVRRGGQQRCENDERAHAASFVKNL